MSEETTEQQDTEAKSDDASAKAQEAEEKHERARETMKEIEKDPPEKLEDWPDDEAKYETFGASEEGNTVYDEKHEEALGEHSVRHHDDGSVEVKGEKVDNPDEYKGDPIPGGPTDPDAPPMPGEEKSTDKSSGESDDDSDDDGDEDDDREE
jgi:hypothetical protein